MTQPVEGEPKHDGSLVARQEEINSILAWVKILKEKAQDWEIPVLVNLLDIGRGLVIEKAVRIERDGRETQENWLFVQQVAQPQMIKQTLSEELVQTFKDLALKIGVLEDTVCDVAIKTKVLLDNFKNDQPLFLPLGSGLEGLRLVPLYLLNLTTTQAQRIGYRLEYYSFSDQARDGQLRSLLVHSDLKEISLAVLFPQLLVFTSHVASKTP